MCRQHADASGSTTVQDREVLPTNVKAIHYDLTMEPDFSKFTFDGHVEIQSVLLGGPSPHWLTLT